MPLFYQQNINASTRLAIWKIEETEDFFSGTVPLQREITHPHKRLQHLAARYLLRYLFPGFPYEEILIASTRKPFLANEQYHFSISHCGDYAAAIVSSNFRVGIDIEIPSNKVLKIAHKFLHKEELAAFAINNIEASNNQLTSQPINQSINQPINQLTNQPINQLTNPQINQLTNPQINQLTNQPINQLTLLWSAKEAMFKWWGNGEVDFSEMMRLQKFDVASKGSFDASFKEIALQINYHLFDKLCLAWVAS